MIDDFLRKHGVLEAEDPLRKLIFAVRDVPWGEAREVAVVLEKGCGTCTGKHLLLAECLDRLGFDYQHVVGTFRWRDKGLQLPEHLQSILDEGVWLHAHNFLRIQVEDKWIDVDITWDKALKSYGFSVLPDGWNGQSFVGVSILERWDDVDVKAKKKELLAALSPEERERRERFLKVFIGWVESLR